MSCRNCQGWPSVLRNAAQLPVGDRIAVCKCAGDPSGDGIRRSVGQPAGQTADWRLQLQDGSGLHIQRLRDGSYTVHRDAIDPATSVIAHGAVDAPVAARVIGTASAIGIGFAVGGPAGAIIGGVLGFAASSGLTALGRRR